MRFLHCWRFENWSFGTQYPTFITEYKNLKNLKNFLNFKKAKNQRSFCVILEKKKVGPDKKVEQRLVLSLFKIKPFWN